MLLAASAWRLRAAKRDGVAALRVGAVTSWLLIPGFLWLGDWPMIARSIPKSSSGYAVPYHAGKYQAHGVWFLADAELEGNLFNEYYMGSFLGYWLSPRLRAFVNGSLNVPPDVIRVRCRIGWSRLATR